MSLGLLGLGFSLLQPIFQGLHVAFIFLLHLVDLITQCFNFVAAGRKTCDGNRNKCNTQKKIIKGFIVALQNHCERKKHHSNRCDARYKDPVSSDFGEKGGARQKGYKWGIPELYGYRGLWGSPCRDNRCRGHRDGYGIGHMVAEQTQLATIAVMTG
jgi:hypothetical protein